MEMFKDTQKKILKLFKADDSYYSVIVSGSGTSANETVLSSLFTEGQSVLLITNGMFGERLEEIINKYKIPMVKMGFEWSQYPDLNKIEQAIKDNPQVAVVAMVYHETSTGMINPVGEVGAFCKKYGKIFSVDAVSAAAGENIDVVKQNIDVITSVAGKCLGGFPGSAYVCAKESLLQKLTEEQCKNVYLNLYKHYKIAKKSAQTPNTPNVTLFWPLNRALTDIIDEEGLDNRIARYKECSGIIREGLKKMGLKILLDDKMSNTVTSVFLPAGVELEKFITGMETAGYVIYAGKGVYYEQGMFQIANMGDIYPKDCHKFLKVLEAQIAKEKSASATVSAGVSISN
jgi:2-aminoethylphosphonate-pyruvate transaminase